jgi:uncharacterized SAM-binding protein YcdF (DUF218 family)
MASTPAPDRTDPGEPDPGRRHRTLARRMLALATAPLVLVALVAGYQLYLVPLVDPVSARDPADAVLALGGDSRAAGDAYRLAETGAARTVVLSDPYPAPSPLDGICHRPAGAVPIICFRPDPSTTQGEAEELRDLVAAHGWHHVIVMAPTFHITRARMIVRRCFDQRLAMVAVPERYPLYYWIYQVGYQTLGFAKALLVTRGC